MKKLIAILAVGLLGVIPASAQYWGPYSAYSSAPAMEAFWNSVNRRVITLKKVPWVSQVLYEERHVQPGGYTQSSFYTFHTTDFPQLQAHAAHKNIYEERLKQIRAVAKQNHTLSKYTFVATHPVDIAILPQGDLKYLIGFLQQPDDEAHFNKAYTPSSVKQAEKGVTEVKLLTKNNNTLILRVDSFKKKVFFFLNEY
ncbi:MAG: hypothetical protein J6Y25_06160 [Elusimicrobiaceae bacterium]|nr:hypothetical protein [Elusimicrobiaceae bacterium]